MNTAFEAYEVAVNKANQDNSDRVRALQIAAVLIVWYVVLKLIIKSI